MSWSLIAHDGAVGLYGPIVTPSMDTTTADLLIVEVSRFTAGSPVTLSDSKSNTWTALTERITGTLGSQLFYAENPTVGSGHTFQITNGDFVAGGLIVQAWSGAALSSVFGNENGATGSGASLATGSITPSQDGCLIIAGMACADGTSTPYSIDSGFTANAEAFGWQFGDHEGVALASFVQTTAAAINPTWSVTGTGAIAACIASFKPASGSPDVTLALTGVAGASAAGSLTPSRALALTGNSATGVVGTLTPALNLVLTGAAATGNVGSLTPSRTVGLTGATATGSVGSLLPSLSVALTGTLGTGSVGSVSVIVGGDVTIALTSVSAAGSVGSLVPSRVLALNGIEITLSVGSLTPSLSVAISGVGIIARPGSVTASGGDAAAGTSGISGPGINDQYPNCTISRESISESGVVDRYP